MRRSRFFGSLAGLAMVCGSVSGQTDVATPAAASSASAALDISARMVEAPAGPGASGRFDVVIDVAEGWSITGAGIPGAVLQIDPPEDLTLAGEVLKDHRALARNGFLHAPFERMIESGTTSIEFSVGQVFEPGASTIGINVIAYMRQGDDASAHFVRTRVELPLAAEAVSKPADANDTSWGDERSGMQVGDKAQLFELPRADGSLANLKDYVGKKNIIVTTYRAFW